MALLDIKLRSQVLGKDVAVNVIISEKRCRPQNTKVLWLLHGMRHNHCSWIRQTSVERYVEEKNLCVIMPDVDISYYTNMIYGGAYFSYITDELPKIMGNILQITLSRDNNYIAGVSMGGYGAFKAAFAFPNQYSMAASISGVMNVKQLYDSRPNDTDLIRSLGCIFGDIDNVCGTINDLNFMVAKQAKEQKLPNLYMCCGDHDFLYPQNNEFYNKLYSLSIPVLYDRDKGYSHNWNYWDIKIQRVLEWMGL